MDSSASRDGAAREDSPPRRTHIAAILEQKVVSIVGSSLPDLQAKERAAGKRSRQEERRRWPSYGERPAFGSAREQDSNKTLPVHSHHSLRHAHLEDGAGASLRGERQAGREGWEGGGRSAGLQRLRSGSPVCQAKQQLPTA